MLTVAAPAVLDGHKLRAELAARGVTVTAGEVFVRGDELVFPDLSDSDAATVTGAVDAHMSRAESSVPEEDTALAAIRTKAQEVAAGTGTFTAAQVQKILAHLVLRTTR